jgi:ankyrin repeat protein
MKLKEQMMNRAIIAIILCAFSGMLMGAKDSEKSGSAGNKENTSPNVSPRSTDEFILLTPPQGNQESLKQRFSKLTDDSPSRFPQSRQSSPSLPAPTISTTTTTPSTPTRTPPTDMSPTLLTTPVRSSALADIPQTPPRPGQSPHQSPDKLTSPVRRSPRLEDRYRSMPWQTVIERVKKMLDQGQGETAKDALWIKAFYVSCDGAFDNYSGEKYKGVSIFHLLALMNDVKLADEVWSCLKRNVNERGEDIALYQNFLDEQYGVFDCCNGFGNPLHMAIKNGNATMVRWLHNHGADVNYECNDRRHHYHADCACMYPPLHYIFRLKELRSRSRESMKRIIALLLHHGADPNIKSNNRDGDTALHLAFRNKHPLAHHLVHERTDVSAKNNYGNTPLHVLAMNPNVTSVDDKNNAFIFDRFANRMIEKLQPNDRCLFLHTENQRGRTCAELAQGYNPDLYGRFLRARQWTVNRPLPISSRRRNNTNRYQPY